MNEVKPAPNSETAPLTRLLRIDTEHWKKYYFMQISLSGDIAKVLNGNRSPEEETGGEIDEVFDTIIQQLREQQVECKTSISLTSDGRFLLQINPTIGTTDTVNNIFAESPEGEKVIEIHNHPVYEDPDTHTSSSYGFFSAPDLTGFAFRVDTRMAEAVVFEQGTAILVKTPESERIISNAIQKTDMRKWAWTRLGNNLTEQFIREVPSDSYEERRTFSINFARKYAMRLLFIPNGSRKIEVLV
jgi:hypothetical protein